MFSDRSQSRISECANTGLLETCKITTAEQASDSPWIQKQPWTDLFCVTYSQMKKLRERENHVNARVTRPSPGLKPEFNTPDVQCPLRCPREGPAATGDSAPCLKSYQGPGPRPACGLGLRLLLPTAQASGPICLL